MNCPYGNNYERIRQPWRFQRAPEKNIVELNAARILGSAAVMQRISCVFHEAPQQHPHMATVAYIEWIADAVTLNKTGEILKIVKANPKGRVDNDIVSTLRLNAFRALAPEPSEAVDFTIVHQNEHFHIADVVTPQAMNVLFDSTRVASDGPQSLRLV